jgi:membrane fusion protein, adhesin transport system
MKFNMKTSMQRVRICLRYLRLRMNKVIPLTLSHALSADRDQKLISVLLGMFFVFVLWACFAPVDRIVRAEGRIIASGRAQIVQHLEGGIVNQIMVHEGQAVQAGQVLMRLSDVQANSSVKQGQSRVHALKAQQARLTAEADGLAQPVFSDEIPQDLQQSELSVFRERAARATSEQAALRQQISQRQAELVEAHSRSKSLSTELELARKQASLMDGLVRRGAASQMEQLEAQSKAERLKTSLNDVVNSVPRLQSAIGESTARLNEGVSRWRSDARSELSQVTADLARVEYVVDGDEDRLSRTEVKAPMAGFINRLYFNTIGGVAKSGEPLLEITPSDGALAVEARVRPDDRASLRPGLPTRVLIGAYDYAVYGALQGKLVEVSADTLPDENGQRYYRVLIETESAQGRLAQEVILPGMTARADVVLGQRSVMSYLLSPLLRFKAQALREPT